jgi:ubiquinone biosynthesis monooxygenase Coq6
VQRDRVQAYQEMQVWDGVTGARIEFDWEGQKKGNTIAYMNENLNLTSGLLKRIDEIGGVDIFDNEKVEEIKLGEEREEMDLRSWPVVKTSGGREMAARLLVGADGPSSPVRVFAGIGRSEWDYKRVGVVASLSMEGEGWGKQGDKIAYQRFMPTGPIALLPLPGNHATMVWSTTPAIAQKLKAMSYENLTAMINAAFRLSQEDLECLLLLPQEELFANIQWRLSQSKNDNPHKLPQQVVQIQEGTVASFPLKLRHADTYIGERVALVGDAAHTIHPLAGQGLNQGQADVESLVKNIEYSITHGQDIGVRLSLEAYDADRYTANHVMLGVCDKLHKLYSVGTGPLVGLRSLGLRAVNSIGPVKQLIMQQAAGSGANIS